MGSFHVALLEALVSAGVPSERARAVVDLFDRSIDERYALHAQILTTKRDLADLDRAVRGDVAALAQDLAGLETRVTREISSLRVDTLQTLHSVRVDALKWILGALTVQTALLLSAAKLF